MVTFHPQSLFLVPSGILLGTLRSILLPRWTILVPAASFLKVFGARLLLCCPSLRPMCVRANVFAVVRLNVAEKRRKNAVRARFLRQKGPLGPMVVKRLVSYCRRETGEPRPWSRLLGFLPAAEDSQRTPFWYPFGSFWLPSGSLLVPCWFPFDFLRSY